MSNKLAVLNYHEREHKRVSLNAEIAWRMFALAVDDVDADNYRINALQALAEMYDNLTKHHWEKIDEIKAEMLAEQMEADSIPMVRYRIINGEIGEYDDANPELETGDEDIPF